MSFRYIRLANEVVHSAKSSGSNLAKPFGEHPEHFYLVSRSSIAAGAAAEGDRQSRGEGEGEGPTLSSHIQLQYIFSALLHFHFFPHSISWHYKQCTVSERKSFAFIFRSLLFLFFCFSARRRRPIVHEHYCRMCASNLNGHLMATIHFFLFTSPYCSGI